MPLYAEPLPRRLEATEPPEERGLARDLGVSEKTVKTHVSNILGKLGLTDRTQAALYAVREGWVD